MFRRVIGPQESSKLTSFVNEWDELLLWSFDQHLVLLWLRQILVLDLIEEFSLCFRRCTFSIKGICRYSWAWECSGHSTLHHRCREDRRIALGRRILTVGLHGGGLNYCGFTYVVGCLGSLMQLVLEDSVPRMISSSLSMNIPVGHLR